MLSDALFGLEMPLAARFFIAVLVVLGIGLIAWLLAPWTWKQLWAWKQPKPPPIQFAKIITEKPKLGAGVGFSALMLIIFSFVALNLFIEATTVLQQTVALLVLIGNNTFWGIFIIAGSVNRTQTHIVYSDIAVNLEKNIARLEKMQEQASSVTAVTDAVALGAQESKI